MVYHHPKPKSLWPEDTDLVEHFDPFSSEVPGDTVSERLQYLFLYVIPLRTPDEWRQPDSDNMKILTLKSLYASMIGFNRDNLPLLYPSGKLGNTLDELWLTKAQHTERSSVRDRCCGHVFGKGETYYRCKYIYSSVRKINVENVAQTLRSSSVEMFQHSGSQRSLGQHARRKWIWWML